ncbi:MAG: UDP-N-acetylglucosamine 2-epimerase (non-hydrolyzing) [Haliea sp.]|nr:UDP-N-acetylglucosamine 2-epimerase (non-hydrolyzing) [Haliea sp.]
MKIVTIVGARPQFVKAAVVSRALASDFLMCREVIVHTGQHFDSNMSEVFFNELNIPQPNYNLGVGGGSHGQNTGRMIERIENVLKKELPDCVLVYGDTDSTLAGALAAVKLNIPVAHVEAGLRSFNRRMPEEINRILTDHASTILFSPTDIATRNLKSEGIDAGAIHQVGDVMYDATLYYSGLSDRKSRILNDLSLHSKNYILATVHRAGNTDTYEKISSIVKGFAGLSKIIIWPMHPRTKQKIASLKIDLPKNVRVIDPVGYLDMIMLEKNAALIATDSGGVQKEAYFHNVPCITLRDETEWVELIDTGMNRLVSTSPELIKDSEIDFFSGGQIETTPFLYGDGKASLKIIKHLRF